MARKWSRGLRPPRQSSPGSGLELRLRTDVWTDRDTCLFVSSSTPEPCVTHTHSVVTRWSCASCRELSAQPKASDRTCIGAKTSSFRKKHIHGGRARLGYKRNELLLLPRHEAIRAVEAVQGVTNMGEKPGGTASETDSTPRYVGTSSTAQEDDVGHGEFHVSARSQRLSSVATGLR